MKKLFLLLSIVLLFFSSSNTYAADLSAENIELLMEQQQPSVDAYNVLMNSFQTNGYEIIYPEDYAGAYVEKNILYVVLTRTDNTEKYQQILSNYECIDFKYVKYSLNELENATSQAMYRLKDIYSVSGGYVDVMNNAAVIEIMNYNEAFSKQVQSSILDIDIPIQIKPGYTYADEVDLVNGSEIEIVGAGSFTLGIGGTYNGMKVLVTAAHFSSVGQKVKYNGVEIGQVIFRQFANNQNGDFAFIKITNSDYKYTPLVYNQSSGSKMVLKGTTERLPVGAYVYRYGMKSRECYAKIDSINYNMATSITVANTYRAQIITGFSAPGDSGGPVRFNNTFCGIHKGSVENSKSIVFTPYYQLQSKGFTAFVN